MLAIGLLQILYDNARDGIEVTGEIVKDAGGEAPKDGIYYTKMLFDAGHRFYNDFINKRDWFMGRR